MMFFRKTLLVFGLFFGLSTLATCATTQSELVQGRVLEEDVNKPIPDAIVIARWNKTYSSFADTTTVCVHVESASTDAQGRYRLPRWRGKAPYGLDAFKIGYERSPEYYRSKAYLQNSDILKPFRGTREERLDYLLHVSSVTRCGQGGTSENNLLLLKKVLYEEARSIAITAEDHNKVETLLFGLESLEFGSVEALNRMTERRKAKK